MGIAVIGFEIIYKITDNESFSLPEWGCSYFKDRS